MIEILRRSMTSLTYKSLCIPDDIVERGLESVPNFYYRDDGLRLWHIINRYRQLPFCIMSILYKDLYMSGLVIPHLESSK